MIKRLLLLLCIITGMAVKAQRDSLPHNDSGEPLPPALGEAFKPTIGLGTGVLSFWGDLNGGKAQSPWTSRIAYDLTLSQPLNHYLFLDFYVLFGKLGMNERSGVRNENFESEIRLGGINLMYDFSNFIPAKKYRCRPWLSLGIEGFEYLSKTDLYDRYGRKYYYWNDGSVKNMAEGTTGSQNAIDLVRDYTYESDIRELNKDGFGKYPERSWAIPMGIGFMYRLNKRFDFKMGTTLHMSFTDYIDGISDKSKGDRAGNKANDKFVMTSFSLQYDLVTKKEDTTGLNGHSYEEVDFLAMDVEDEDGDGVSDFNDESHKTPAGVTVDEKGRPVDSDGDWIPDYRDEESTTPSNMLADGKGVGITDPVAQNWFDRYFDSTGVFSKVINVDSLAMVERGIKVKSLDRKYYTVELGRFKGGIPSFVMEYLLSINDVSSLEEGDSIIMYNAGSYEDVNEAIKRQKEFIAAGVDDAKIAYFLKDQFVILGNEELQNEVKQQTELARQIAVEDSIRLVKLYGHLPKDSSATHVANNTITVAPKDSTQHGVNTVMPKDTAQLVTHTTTITPKDTAHQLANTVSPKDTVHHVANTVTPKDTALHVTNNHIPKDTVAAHTNVHTNAHTNPNNTATATPVHNEYEGIIYRVQLGAYRNKLSPTFFKNAGKILELKTEDGYYKYVTISYKTLDEAVRHRAELLTDGYPDAFVSAYKDGKRISLAKAGAHFENKKEEKKEVLDESKNLVSAVDKHLISYKVQLGVVRTEGSDPEFNEKIKNMQGIDKQTTITGLLRYTAGDFRNYNDALKLKNSLVQKGFKDAFVIATFKGELISIQEANELTR